MASSTFSISSDHPVFVNASSDRPLTLYNNGDTFYYAPDNTVDSGDTAVTAASTVALTSPQWLISASTSLLEVLDTPDTESLGSLSLSGTFSVAGALTPAGGVEGGLLAAYNVPHSAVDTGTDTAGKKGTIQITSIFVPANLTVTNINYAVGATGGTDHVECALYDAAGTSLGNSEAKAATTVGTAKTIQTVPLVTPVAIVGPATYFVSVGYDGATATIYTVPANLSQGILGGSASQTFKTFAAITPPTDFTADTAPYVFLN